MIIPASILCQRQRNFWPLCLSHTQTHTPKCGGEEAVGRVLKGGVLLSGNGPTVQPSAKKYAH